MPKKKLPCSYIYETPIVKRFCRILSPGHYDWEAATIRHLISRIFTCSTLSVVSFESSKSIRTHLEQISFCLPLFNLFTRFSCTLSARNNLHDNWATTLLRHWARKPSRSSARKNSIYSSRRENFFFFFFFNHLQDFLNEIRKKNETFLIFFLHAPASRILEDRSYRLVEPENGFAMEFHGYKALAPKATWSRLELATSDEQEPSRFGILYILIVLFRKMKYC